MGNIIIFRYFRFAHKHRPATHPNLIGMSLFFYTNLEQVSRFPFPIPSVKIPGFRFVSKLENQKGVSLCYMARVSKPTKCGLKINDLTVVKMSLIRRDVCHSQKFLPDFLT